MARVNKAIELLEQGQPVYYITTREFTYESGLALSNTWADIIRLDLEHGVFDMGAVRLFMKGLLDGGPTKSGHATPTVIAELPTDGLNESVMLANAWMIKQVLAQGVHGILLCHAESPSAVRVFNEFSRYSFHAAIEGLGAGRRGYGGQEEAAHIWSISEGEYLEKADLWPLNPNGELLMGVKIENTRALDFVKDSLKVPGLAYAEWGPGDMGMSMGYPNQHAPPYPESMINASIKVRAECDNNKLFFLNQVEHDDVKKMIDQGIMILKPSLESVADVGRIYSNRSMPW